MTCPVSGVTMSAARVTRPGWPRLTLAAGAVLLPSAFAGEMRVLIGSTFKMGAGMNVQKRIVAIQLENELSTAQVSAGQRLVIPRG